MCNTIRFVTTKFEGVKLAEELCDKPMACLTILVSNADDDKEKVLSFRYPHYMANIIQVL